MAGHCSRNEQNRWAVSCRASSPDISLSLLLTSINKKQLPLRNCDEERCLTINQLISRREHQTRETFLRGFSGKPRTARQTLILGTSTSKLITSSFYCHQMTNNLGLMQLCIQVHQNAMSGDKRWINHRSQIPVLGLQEQSAMRWSLWHLYHPTQGCCWQRCPPPDNGNESWRTNTAALLRFSSVSASLNTLSLSTARLFLYSCQAELDAALQFLVFNLLTF